MHRFYNNAQWWSKEMIEEWQLIKLKEIITYAYNNVYGYHQLYKEFGIVPKDIKRLKVLVKKNGSK
mgnify:CR=1 FL=1